MAPFKAAQLQKGKVLGLAQPFNKSDRGIMARHVDKLIKKRANMNERMMKAMEHLGQSSSAQLQQEELLQMSLRMKSREKKFIRRQSMVLDEREKLYEMDPSEARAHDVKLLKMMLSKLSDEAGSPKTGPNRNSARKVGDGISPTDSDSKFENSSVDEDYYHSSLETDLSVSPVVSKPVGTIS